MSRSVSAVVGLLCLATSASAQSPQRRLPVTFSELPLRHLAGTTHPLAKSTGDGRVAAYAPFDRMLLMLQASPEQEAALQDLLAGQHDPLSPLYHQWLTPQEFGARFGASDQDIDTITAWLGAKGFQINNVANSRRYIEFSGVVSQVENAFHTVMRHYTRNGVQHVANSTDISIPEALAPVVAGIASLNDFHAEPLFHSLTPVFLNAPPSPLLTTSTGGHALAPGDFATIYNVGPLYSGNINGAGQTIAVVGRTNFNMSDVTTFRSTFGLPANNPQIVLAGTNPGIVSASEVTEALLEVEWAGAVAKNATVKFVLAASTTTTGGETLSAAYAVNNNIAPVISSSFGLCEAQLGSENQFYNSLWQQAAAQGISVIVAAGDNGSAGCDSPAASSPASLGLAVSGIASTPWNTAIGGTALNEGSSPSTYWSSVNSATLSSALSYIPEVVWNDSVYVSAGNSANNLYAGSGGVSSLYATPSWQTGAGVPAVDPNTTSSHHRYLPDVSLSAAGHDPYVIVLNGALYGVGGTSAGAPSFAGIMALVNQHAGGRQGNAASTLYTLASQSPSAFHDVVAGTNTVPCQVGSPACVPISGSIGAMSGWSAAPAYDLATGLGSVNAYNLVTSWPSNSTAPASSTVNVSGTDVTAGGSSNAKVFTVHSAATNGVPTITGVSPGSGARGQVVPVTITGTNFISGATVGVRGVGVKQGSFVVVSSTQMTAVFTISASAVLGTDTVTVTTSAGVSNTFPFNVVASAAPAITNLGPTSGVQGQAVAIAITGTNFITGSTVNVSGTGVTAGSVVVASATSITATLTIAPTANAGPYYVTVTTSGGVSNTTPFTVNAAAPSIINLSPASGVQGQAVPVAITGTNFITGATVNVSGTGVTVGSVVIASATSITATLTIAPNANAGPYNVTVTTSGGVSNTTLLTVNPAAPTITNLSPTSGVQGQSVPITITGTNFITGSTVNVSGTGLTVGSVVVASATRITATLTITPSATTGSHNVTVATAGGVSNSALFSVNPAVPTVTNLSPASGVQGKSVPIAITGTNFVTGSTVNISGTGVSAGSVVVASATSITATLTIAPNAAAAAYNVTIANTAGTSNSAMFTVNPAVPAITNLSPASGVQGQSVPTAITGTNFITGSTVNVSGTGVTAGGMVVASATSITATLTIAPNANVGSYNVTVTTAGGVSNTAPFTVNPATPAIANLIPTSGSQGQSVPITITGTNFIAGSTVNVSGTGVTAGSVVVASATSITATLTTAPNAAAGTYNITVTTSGGISNTAPFTVNPAASFTYYVDAVNGLDSNPGTGALPWKTVSKVNAATLAAGQSVGFSRGRIWRETLIIGQSGSAGNPVQFGAYGTGAAPIFDGRDVIASGWSASSQPGTVSGRVTQANLRLSLASGAAFADFSSAGALVPYLNGALTLTDSAGKHLVGYIKAAGGGETYGAELLPNPAFGDTSGVISFQATPASVAGGQSGNGLQMTLTAAAGSCAEAFAGVPGAAYLSTQYAKIGTAQRIILYFSNPGGSSSPLIWGITPAAFTQYSMYATADGPGTYKQVYDFEGASGQTAFIDTASMKQVLTPGATGVTITSAPGGSGFNWASEDAGFNRNDASGYTYTINYTTGVPNTWQAAAATQPNIVFFDGVLGQKQSTAGAVANDKDWNWTAGVLTVHSVGNPAATYTSPGVEAGARALVINPNGQDYFSLSNLMVDGANGQTLLEGAADHVSLSQVRMGFSIFMGVYFGDPTVRSWLTLGLHQNLDTAGASVNTRATYVTTAGGVISRSSLRWDLIEQTKGVRNWAWMDAAVSACQAAGTQPLFTIFGSPQWANGSSNPFVVPTDATARAAWVANYRNFAVAAANRYHNSVKLWELWNEATLQDFWSPFPSVNQYLEWAQPVYADMKAIDPSLRIVMGFGGALGGDGVNNFNLVTDFLPVLYAAGFYADGLGVHLYSRSDDGTVHPAPNVHAATGENFDAIAALRSYMVSAGRGSDPVWATEWGWPSGSDLTPALQAQYLVQSLQMFKDLYPYVSLGTIFSDVDFATGNDFATYGLRNSSLTRKTADRAVWEFSQLWGGAF